MTPALSAVRIRAGTYRIDLDGKYETVYVAGSRGNQWAFWNGRVFQLRAATTSSSARRAPRAEGVQALTAPMPATVVKVLAVPGSSVRHGDTLLVLEAMKMELPIRAPGNGTVQTVHCREGDLVQPDSLLIELT